MGLSPSVSGVDAATSDDLWVTLEGYTQPTTLALATAADPEALQPVEALKALPAFFDAGGLETRQHYATSRDGTQVNMTYYMLQYVTALRYIAGRHAR